MSLVSNTYQGTNGANVTVAASGGASGNPYQLVNPSNSDNVEYYSGITNPITNTASVGKFDASLDGVDVIGEVRFVKTGAIHGASQVVIRFSGYPGSTCVIIQHRGTIQNGDIRINTSGTLASSLGGATSGLSPSPVPLNTWIVIDWWIEEGTTTTNGKSKWRYRLLSDLTTTIYEYNASDRSTGVQGTDTITDWRIGKFTGTSILPPFYVAQHRADDGATTYIPNPTTTTTANAGADQSNVEPWTTVTLTGTGTGSWSQVSGTSVTLGGSGTTRTFTAPASLSTQTLIFSYGGDQMSVTVLPATEAIYSGGQWRPVRFIRNV